MDKYKTKTAFNKWFSSINFNQLSKEAQQDIAGFNRYVKKFRFETTLKLFLHGINAEKESLRHLDTSMVSPDLQRELGLDSISHTQLSRTLTKLTPAVLWGDFSSAGWPSGGLGQPNPPTQSVYSGFDHLLLE